MEWDEEILTENHIVFTPEMVEAGASVLYRMELMFAPEGFWAKEVYEAMEKARLGK